MGSLTALDIIVLTLVGGGAVLGFSRGLVQEVLSLASWIMAAFALHFLHPLLAEGLRNFYRAEPAVSLLAFALLLIPYAGMKVIIGTASGASDGAVLGRITAMAFNQRRKMLRSSLKGLGPDVEEKLVAAGIPPTARAEEISLEAFCALARLVAGQAA